MSEEPSARHDVEKQFERLEIIAERLEKGAENAARAIVLEQVQEAERSIREEVRGGNRRIAALISILVGLVGLVTFLGITSKIENGVNKYVEDTVKEELRVKLDTMDDELTEVSELKQNIKRIYAGLKKNHPIQLITDYGQDSPDMAALYGALLRYDPQCRIYVITAGISSFNVVHAAWTLLRSVRNYPRDSIFVVIVAAGGRDIWNPMIVRTDNGYTLLGYDNGAFDLVVREYGHAKSYIVDGHLFLKKYGLQKPGDNEPEATDILSPIAARLAMEDSPWSTIQVDTGGGRVAWTEVVRENESYRWNQRISSFMPEVDSDLHTIKGAIMEIDEFGNALTNVKGGHLQKIMDLRKQMAEGLASIYVHYSDGEEASFTLHLPVGQDFEIVGRGQEMAMIDNNGFLQLALSYGNFAEKYHVENNAMVKICTRKKPCN